MLYVIYLVFLQFAAANYDSNSKLIDKAVALTSEYYRHRSVTYVAWSDGDSEGVNEFLMKYPGSIVTIPISNNNNTAFLQIKRRLRCLQTVIFTSEPEIFQKFSALINKKIKFPLRLILVLKWSICEPSEIATFFGIAWQNNLADVVIISKNCRDDIIISTYFPYTNNICDNITPVTLKPAEHIFINKFNNFNKCPIRASVINVKPFMTVQVENNKIAGINGTEGNIFALIVNKLNASLKVKLQPAYGSYRNRIVTDALGDLVYNKSDILLPGAVLNGRYAFTQTSHIYIDADMRWVGPKRRQIYQWIKLLIPFFNNITPFLLLTFILFVVVIIMIRRWRDVSRRHDGGSICFKFFTILLGQTVNYETNVILLNNLLLLWIWFCFIIRLTYQGHLVNSLQRRILEPAFRSLEDALKTIDAYGGSEGMLEFYKGTFIERNYRVFNTEDVYYEYLDRIAAGERLMIILDKISRQRFQHILQTLEMPISSTMLCYYMRREWPAAQAVDSIVVRLLEAGIINKLYFINDNKLKEKTDKDNYAPLDLLMISSCFYIIGFMWFVCIIIFVIEIYYYKYSHFKL